MCLFFLLLLPFSATAACHGLIRVHQADVFRLKCDSLPYRSLVDQTSCFFAIPVEMEYAAGGQACAEILPGAQMATNGEANRMLRRMFLNPSAYHDSSSRTMKKNVMCRYVSDYDCKDGSLELPGICVSRSSQPVTWREAEKFCRERDSTIVVIRNADENKIYGSLLAGSESAWLLPGHEAINNWSAGEENVGYWSWFSGDGTAGSVERLKCSASQHAVISRKPENECAGFGGWKVDESANKNITICTKPAICPFCPAAETETTPVPTEEVTVPETTETVPETTETVPQTTVYQCIPKNDPPTQDMLWKLKYYYNWGSILHAFAATPEGYNQIMNNGIGYSVSDGSGTMGMTISDEGYTKLERVCSDPEQRKHVVKMWFIKKGRYYEHSFTEGGVYVGYVSLAQKACGASLGKKGWGCIMSHDLMYAEDLRWNTWYASKLFYEGRVQFWLWEENAAVRDNQRECKLPSTTP